MVAREVNTAFTWQGNHLNVTLESSDSKYKIFLIKKEIHNYEALKCFFNQYSMRITMLLNKISLYLLYLNIRLRFTETVPFS
jgi:hypothetical protein